MAEARPFFAYWNHETFNVARHRQAQDAGMCLGMNGCKSSVVSMPLLYTLPWALLTLLASIGGRYHLVTDV